MTPASGGSYLRGSAALRTRAARGECRGVQPRGSELASSGSGCSRRRRRRRKGGKGGGRRRAEERAEGGAWAEPSTASPAGERAAGLGPHPLAQGSLQHPTYPSSSVLMGRNPRSKMARLAHGFASAFVMLQPPGQFLVPVEGDTLCRRASEGPGKLLNPPPAPPPPGPQ